MKLKALIVDDEYPSRAELRYFLHRFQDKVEIIGEATHVAEARALLSALPYDLLFLDIEMPGLNGLELARELLASAKSPFIVFVTAYQDYAVQAFEVNAIDYLLKPFDEKRLAQTLKKVFRASELLNPEKESPEPDKETPGPNRAGSDTPPGAGLPGAALSHAAPPGSGLDRLLAERQGKRLLVDKKEVVFAFVEDNAIYLKLYNEALLTRYTMKELVCLLQEPMFFRTHRQYLVNLLKVREIIPYFNSAFTLVVDDAQHTEVPVSRGQVKKLRSLLGM
ncbi:MAG: LytTR family DNA-binding domain-containing protein [Firmicutes bacterium]|nr:LytTR family DNA-binding domain-containing protein [Bacillota bacterium]